MADNHVSRIPVVAFGFGLSTFFVVSYVVCILGYLAFPTGIPHTSLELLLPFFKLLTWQSFFLGLVETFLWGWYIALVFAPLFNFFARRFR